MKKKKNRLTNLIKWELLCLVAVTVLVAGLVKWSEGRADANGNTGIQQTGSGTVKAQEGPGEGSFAEGADETEENQGAENGNVPSGSGSEGMPADAQEPDDGMASQNPAQDAGKSAGEPGSGVVTPEPTQGAGVSAGEQNPGGGASKSESTPTSKPQNTPTSTPTPKPENTPTPTPQNTPTPTPKPQNTPTPTPKPENTPTPKPNYADGMDADFIESLDAPQSGELLTVEGAVDTVYYMQTDSRWGSKIYGGEDTIAKYACGPTSMAIVVSSLTDIGIDPLQMSGWAYSKGYWYPKSGSLHSVVNGTAKAFGLKSEGVGNDSDTPKKVKDALQNGDMVVALMGKGHFTKGGHFIVLRGITAEGKILVADCNSRENTMTEWDFETIQSEAKWASDGGPFWIIRNPNIMQ